LTLNAGHQKGLGMTEQAVHIRRALISVTDKTGLDTLGGALHRHGIELISTGGTATALRALGLAVTDVSDMTGFPEMLDGRVKTLHPGVHGGLLAVRGKAEHEAAIAAHNIAPIDLLVVNLYAFEQALSTSRPFETMIETIDIGGPAMIRSAAKNHAGVAVVIDPSDYGALMSELDASGGSVSPAFRRTLAAKAFARTAAYDAAISEWLAQEAGLATPLYRAFAGKLAQTLRYGENPHQAAALYATAASRPGVVSARQVQGKELSYNNIADADAAFELAAELGMTGNAVAIIKHANPCGAATAGTLAEAYTKALMCDPVSAFGGIVALSGKLDVAAASEIAKIFTEVVIAPEADPEALKILSAKAGVRVLLTGALPDPRAPGDQVRSVAGGLLVQQRDARTIAEASFKVVTKRAPTEAEAADLRFAFTLAKHVKSNAIVYARDAATVGIGAGQMSRVDSARNAAWKAAEAAKAAGLEEPLTAGSVAASDAFFPFADGLEAIAAAGATAVIQPGGSMRDGEVVAAADALGLAMVLTGQRHFRH
jgi:phosphoribosylaminoimidazolecarboxamide formyltransferase/IMP cyclohydrolase